jgi:hypothetical protein
MRVHTFFAVALTLSADGLLFERYAPAQPVDVNNSVSNGQTMTTCVIKQMRALENKDIDTYMSYVHPQAPNRMDIDDSVRKGMRLGPDFLTRVRPGITLSQSMDVEMSFERLDGGNVVTRLLRV